MVDPRFGRQIQKYREKAGKSQEERAEHVGISITSISNIERGANYPSFENFIKILDFIGTSPNQVLSNSVGSALATRASELWEKMTKLDNERIELIF